MSPLLPLAVLAISMRIHDTDAALETLTVHSRFLKDNPLGDSADRQVAVFLPKGYSSAKHLPVVYFLPGFGGGPEGFIQDASAWIGFSDRLTAAVGPIAFVVVDGKNRFGCSQYIDSAASGQYAQYICKEVVPAVEHKFGLGGAASRRIIAGHSSGGFGALRLGMAFRSLFGHVVALSPDSDFELTHKGFTNSPDCQRLPLSRVTAFMPPNLAQVGPQDGDVGYAITLCACYAADPNGPPGSFRWFYDSKGVYQEATWEMWLRNDPLTIARESAHPFSASQTVYCEGPDHDDFQANVGARLIYEELKRKGIHATFYEPPGHHSDHLPERILRGVAWSEGAPTTEIR